MLKGVFIDVDNTLLDFNKCAAKAIKIIMESRNLDYFDNYFTTFKTINDGLWLRHERGEITKDELYDIRFNLIFADLGLDLDGHSFEAEFRKELYTLSEPVDNALDILKYLHDKYQIFVVSNAYHEQQVSRLKNAGMLDYIDKVFTSELLGVQKPNKEFFEKALQESQLEVEDLILIGDSLTADIKGGKTIGLKTIWFNFQKENSPTSISPDFIIDNLLEVKNIL